MEAVQLFAENISFHPVYNLKTNNLLRVHVSSGIGMWIPE